MGDLAACVTPDEEKSMAQGAVGPKVGKLCWLSLACARVRGGVEKMGR